MNMLKLLHRSYTTMMRCALALMSPDICHTVCRSLSLYCRGQLHCHFPKIYLYLWVYTGTDLYYSTLLLVEWSHSGYVTSCFIYSMVAVLWEGGLSWRLLPASGREMCLLWSDGLSCDLAFGCDVSTWFPATHDPSRPVFLTSVRGSKELLMAGGGMKPSLACIVL